MCLAALASLLTFFGQAGDPIDAWLEEEWARDDYAWERGARGVNESGELQSSFSLEHTGEVIAEGRELINELRQSRQWREGVEEELVPFLESAAAGLESLRRAESLSLGARKQIYLAARRARRAIVLSHPLVDFDDLLFVKRHPGAFPHMCDQYYGGYARAGGGLFVLQDFRGGQELRDLTLNQLPLGSFLSPDLSYDAKQVAFAYAKVDSTREPRFLDNPEWTYHIYTINIDGTGLARLTDGPFDEFDPRWLPNGDIVFCSTRRGGYCRCGARPVPSYTLHRMRPDGSEIHRLSSHETNEWHPVVGNDGSLLYTRWDYVDRHTNLAHSVWNCLPDGSAAMALYGNYNADKKPWGLWHPHPIPGSHKLMVIAGAHHGYAFGSVVRIDPRRGYDGQEPLTRLTPDVAFPEAEGYPNSAYTTPFPLSENVFLVSYSPDWSTRTAEHRVTQGLYLVIVLDNGTSIRELLYRDALISSLSPTPVRRRQQLPVWSEPVHTRVSSEVTGRFILLDVCDSAIPFPELNVTELRIIQVLPKTTVVADQPPISVAKQVSARYLLGTVPVENDGSAYFEAPAGVPLYFQAVNAEGMAVQTMRSVTQLQPGETRSCIGCHEDRHKAPLSRLPSALRRGPSAIQPGPDGTRPFSYVRLVQSVLDRHCARCHSGSEPSGGVLLTGDYPGDSDPYSFSYRALAKRELVHWFDSVNGGEWIPLTTPGEFGARASRLISMLRQRHGGISLPDDDFRRLCLWVDLNAPFYGAYQPEHVATQRAGGVVPLDEILN